MDGMVAHCPVTFMDTAKFDLVIIGAGIVGLATAMTAVQAFPELRIVVLEKEPEIATHQTGHNSGVIHSGIYYRPGSQKAQMCVAGAAALVSFCREHHVTYDMCGKLIVATSEVQLETLAGLQEKAKLNRIPGVRWIEPPEIREFEPHVGGIAALHVPGAGIVDYGEVSKKYAELFEALGGEIRTATGVLKIDTLADRFVIGTTRGPIETKYLINCAGLYSDRIARMTNAVPGVNIVPFRGEYYTLVPEKRYLVRSLVYPVPDPRFPFLGVHFTRHLNGSIEAGPNAVLALGREGYAKSHIHFRDLAETLSYPGFWLMAGRFWKTGAQEMWRSLSQRSFAAALQKLVPEVEHTDLVPAGAGVRAQAIDSNGVLLDDFCFVQSERALHVCNVPSPAATASLAIAKRIIDMAGQQFGLRDLTPASTKAGV
jgi:(S)-2-hydroxyglutarate dehydrogenase